MKFVTDLSRGVLGKPDSPVLWNQILSNVTDEMLLKPDFKALVVACGHCTEAVLLVKRMQSLGIPNSRIQDAIWVLDRYSVFTNQARKYGFKNIITADFLLWDPKGMKFDLVMGNPPYQNSHEKDEISARKIGTKLWIKFIFKMAECLKDDGTLAMITPTSWITGGVNERKGKLGVIKDLFAKKQLIMADISSSVNRFFPGIGIGIGWFVMKNETSYSSSKIQLDSGTIEVDFRKTEFLSSEANETSIGIVQKTLLADNGKYETYYFNTQEDCRIEIYSNENPYPHWIQGSKQTNNLCIRYLPKKKTDKVDYQKIVFSMNTHYWQPELLSSEIGVATLGHALKVDDATYDGFVSVFYSKLFKYLCFNLQIAKNGFMKTNMVRALPKLDLTRTWTDQELYEHFGLTDEEIDYIEEQVK